MTENSAPVVIAYDGSDVAQTAVRQAGELFPGRRAVLVTVWEPGLAAMSMASQDTLSAGIPPPDPETVETVDRLESEHASKVSAQGMELARSVGLEAEACAIPDDLDVADTVLDIARERGAAAVVVGSHGITGLRSRFLGGVSRKLIQHADRPVVVVRDSGS